MAPFTRAERNCQSPCQQSHAASTELRIRCAGCACRFAILLEEHEGLNGNVNSHVGSFQEELNPATAEAVEQLVGGTNDLAVMARDWGDLLAPVAEKAEQQSSNEVFHNKPGSRVCFDCEFNFNVRGR